MSQKNPVPRPSTSVWQARAGSGSLRLPIPEAIRSVNEPAEPNKRKALGAYYTDSQVADFLIWWAVRSKADTVLDPSFGAGVFLRSAARRIRALNGNPEKLIFGVELDASVHGSISRLLRQEFRIPANNLLHSDFFDVLQQFGPVDAVVGNPPFIRFHKFNGDARGKALTRAAEQGLVLSELSSSWLPFLVHSTRFVAEGGRLAMVIPFEIGHAQYARPVLRFLADNFQSVTFLTFRKKLFSDLSEDTLLLLADGKHRHKGIAEFLIRDLAHSGVLGELEKTNRLPLLGVRHLDTNAIAGGGQRLIEALIPGGARDLYRELRNHTTTIRLGKLADVGIGYVTGANDFFHLSPFVARIREIPPKFLRRCVRRGRGLSGLRFTDQDWENLVPTNEAGYLLHLTSNRPLPKSVARYLEDGEAAGVHQGFKCSNRTPWYRVPHVYQPDALLTYMSGSKPKLVANHAAVVAPNSLHILRCHPDSPYSGDHISALWQTSLTQLSVEIEGHSLGGGMLKVEPTEAELVLLPSIPANQCLESLAGELDEIARKRGDSACREYADEHLLHRQLGLTTKDVLHLRAAADQLASRRSSRN